MLTVPFHAKITFAERSVTFRYMQSDIVAWFPMVLLSKLLRCSFAIMLLIFREVKLKNYSLRAFRVGATVGWKSCKGNSEQQGNCRPVEIPTTGRGFVDIQDRVKIGYYALETEGFRSASFDCWIFRFRTCHNFRFELFLITETQPCLWTRKNSPLSRLGERTTNWTSRSLMTSSAQDKEHQWVLENLQRRRGNGTQLQLMRIVARMIGLEAVRRDKSQGGVGKSRKSKMRCRLRVTIKPSLREIRLGRPIKFLALKSWYFRSATFVWKTWGLHSLDCYLSWEVNPLN